MNVYKRVCLFYFVNLAVLEAQAEADALVAVLRHQIQHHVPPTWLQTPMADENAPGNDSGGDLMDSVDGIIHTIEQRVSGAAVCAWLIEFIEVWTLRGGSVCVMIWNLSGE